MNTMTLRLWAASAALLTASLIPGWAQTARPKLNIQQDRANGRAVISWTGSGHQLARSSAVRGKYERLASEGGTASIAISGDQMNFALVSAEGSVISENIVGYVNVALPWGMSLIANPLWQTNVTLRFLFPSAPDGAQVMKFVNGDYVTSVYSASAAGWIGPNFELPVGEGFFFVNPARDTFTQTFVGEVRTGSLTNPLPAGVSFKGDMLPQAGSINTIHGIPGQAGDIIFIFLNEGEARGRYLRSTFSASENAWVPDLELGVAQGFWIQKRNAQDWIRFFSITP
jgi:hypothetical protein